MPRKARSKDPDATRRLTAERDSGERHEDAMARASLLPTVQAGMTVQAYGKGIGDLELGGLVSELAKQASAVSDGKFERGEAMLAAQAHTLDAIFNNLARRAVGAEYIDHLDRYLKLAMRAQSQCRTTWEAVASIKSPPAIRYVRQANIAHGPQQVHNCPGKPEQADPAKKLDIVQNKLLETSHEQRLDSGAPGASGRTDPAMATVGEVDGAEHG